MALDATLLVGNGIVVTGGPDGRVIEDGAVAMGGGRILAVGEGAEVRSAHPQARWLNAQGRVVLPGLINAHMHLYSTFACGLASEPGANFREVLDRLWWRLDRALTPEALRPSALIPLIEGLRRGVTTVVDHHASPAAIPDSLAVLAAAAEEVGVRVNLCYEVSDRGGAAEARAGLAENERHLAACARRAGAMLTGSVGLHAGFTVGPETLAAAADIARRYGVGVHVHVAEDASDEDQSIATYGQRVVERLHLAGALGPRTLAVHAVHVDEAERELLAETGTPVVTNPSSNMNNAVGTADVLGMLREGIDVGLGTDGMSADILGEARMFPLAQRQALGDPRIGFTEAVDVLLGGNARIASALVGAPVGVLSEGARADLVITDYLPFTPMSRENLAGHMLFGVARSGVHTVVVDGRVRLQGGTLAHLDEDGIRYEAQEVVEEVWKRF